MLSGLLPQLREYADKTNTPPLAAPLSEQQMKSAGDEVTKITHTARPMTISSELFMKKQGACTMMCLKRIQEMEKRKQTLDLMMLLSALESWMLSVGKAPPDYLD